MRLSSLFAICRTDSRFIPVSRAIFRMGTLEFRLTRFLMIWRFADVLTVRLLPHMGKYDEAVGIYSEVEIMRTKVLGSNHLLTLTTKHNRASCMNHMGEYDEAFKVYSEVEKIQTEFLGSNHPLTLTKKQSRALCLDHMGKYDEAFEIYSKVENIQTEVLGSNHPSTLTTKHNRALCLDHIGKI